MLAQLDSLSEQAQQFEKRLEELVEVTPMMQWLMTLPGVGVILGATIALEIGEIERFANAERLASYSGTTPAGTFQWRPHAARTDAAGCESLFEMGFCRSGEFGRRESPA